MVLKAGGEAGGRPTTHRGRPPFARGGGVTYPSWNFKAMQGLGLSEGYILEIYPLEADGR